MTSPPTETDRLSDIKAMIQRGNHPSVLKDDHQSTLRTAYDKEVLHGWLIPLQVTSLVKIRNASVIPLGVADQYKVDGNGDRITKSRVTHDCSFESPSGTSINIRAIDDELKM